MSEAIKPTPGEWTTEGAHDDSWSCYSEKNGTSCAKQIRVNGRVVAMAVYQTERLYGTRYEDAEIERNAGLIVEAGNIQNTTGQTPRQLAEQVKVLREALAGMMNYAGIIEERCGDAETGNASVALAATEWSKT